MPWGLVPGDLLTILASVATLVLLEGLLSADNALVLAVMVRHLPKHQQKRALRYGIWGAFLFRLIAVIFAYQLIQYWQLEALGGIYLAYLAVKHFLGGGDHGPSDADVPKSSRFGSGFWGTVVNVELADIAFSIDSILAAVAMVQTLPPKLREIQPLALGIIYVGGILGIVMMRLVAGVFLILLERYKGLAAGAYVMVGWIGIKLLGSGLHHAFHPPRGGKVADWLRAAPDPLEQLPWEMPTWAFWTGMALIAVGSLLYRPKGHHDVTPPRSEDSASGEASADDPAVVAGAAAKRD